MKMFCISINNNHYNKIKKLGYIPVGLGSAISEEKFFKDNSGNNISNKNPYYGEYTFHYWIWKNKIDELNEKWIGFCQYRKFWTLEKNKKEFDTIDELNRSLLKNIPPQYENYESILGEPMFINQFKPSKFIKKNFMKMIKNPYLFLNKNKRNIRFHFDLMHGEGNLDRATALIDKVDRDDFNHFVNTEVSFNPHNMFICKSNKILMNYYNALFPWLERCEKIFGFELEGYGLKRIYGFLAERYMSFWFQKYTKFSLMPIIFKDVSEIN
ncbi:DUF4422 domain-containing protein [Candidatus Pelagibacter bacterium]|jgi:hypothetical protein|nr:DUF4422 domain-containing protein [Candidatus Pelagibacter bacterium]|tara:strand:+ start:714 stop:1520 length:807 start_codon:yes stop_codon:yes gene_type:complete